MDAASGLCVPSEAADRCSPIWSEKCLSTVVGRHVPSGMGFPLFIPRAAPRRLLSRPLFLARSSRRPLDTTYVPILRSY